MYIWNSKNAYNGEWINNKKHGLGYWFGVSDSDTGAIVLKKCKCKNDEVTILKDQLTQEEID